MAVSELARALLLSGPVNIAGDIPNLALNFDDEELEPLPEVRRDPALKALLETGAVDRTTAALLIDRDNTRIDRERTENKIGRIEEQIEEASKEDEGIIATLFGIPVGFQFGTAFGIKNPVTRFAVDLLTDPLFFITGIGAFTKAGLAKKFLLNATSRGGKALSANEKGSQLLKAFKVIGASEVDRGLKKEIVRAAQKVKRGIKPGDGVEDLAKLFRKTANRKFTKEEFRLLDSIDPDIGRILRNEKDAIREFKAAFSLSDKEKVAEQTAGFLDALIKGERSLVRFGIPFTSTDFASFSASSAAKLFKEKGVGGAIKKTIGEPLSRLSDAAKARIQKVHFAQGLDPKDTHAVQEALQKQVDDVVHILDDTTRSGDKRTVSYVSGRHMARAMTGDKSGVSISADQLRNSIKTLIPEKSVREEIGKTKELFGFAATGDDAGRALTEPFKKLANPARHVVAAIDSLFDQVGQMGKKFNVIQDLEEQYLPRLFKAEGNRSLRLLGRNQKGMRGLDKNVREKLRAGEALSEAEGQHVLATFFKNVVRRDRGALPKNRHSFARVFDDIADAERYLKHNPGQFEIVTTDIAELVHHYVRSFGDAVIRNRVLKTGLESPIADDVLKDIAERTAKRTGKEAKLNRFMFTREGFKKAKAGLSPRDQRLFEASYEELNNETFSNFIFHREIVPHSRALFERDRIFDFSKETSLPAKIVDKVIGFNNMMKMALFSINPAFHAMALTMSNFATLPAGEALRSVREVAPLFFKSYSRDPQAATEIVHRILSRTVDGVVDASDVLLEMKRSGLQLGRFKEIEEGFTAWQNAGDKVLSTITERNMVVDRLVGAGKHFNVANDRALWQVVQNIYKTNAWLHIRHAEMERVFKKTGKYPIADELLEINAEAANIANQAFGGLAWERYALEPIAQRALRMAFLAPDWSGSNMLMARDLFVNLPGVQDTMIGRAITMDVLRSDMRFRWAMQYNLRAGFYALAGSNLFNFASTKYRTGKGRWLWENDNEALDRKTGMKTRIELPWTRQDGRRQFMDIFRQFTEPLNFVRNPREYLIAKSGVLPKSIVRFMGEDPFGRKHAGADGGSYAELIRSISSTSGQFLPISAQQAVRTARGELPAASLAFSIAGFPIRSESLAGFQRQQRLEQLKQDLANANR